MSIPATFRYTKEHEWAELKGNSVRVGITDYAQAELGDVVFVDIPEVGKKTKQGASLCTVESVKAVSDIYAPVDGVVVEVNTKLSDSPELINQSAYDGGWIAVIEPSDPAQIEKLMDSAGYQGFLAEIAK